MPPIIVQHWIEYEYEPGWGVSTRGDGVSLHITEEDRKLYVKTKLVADREEALRMHNRNGYVLDSRQGSHELMYIPHDLYEKIKGVCRLSNHAWRDFKNRITEIEEDLR